MAHKGQKWAIFVHGCYWHHHPGCSRATVPRRNRSWWQAKFERNAVRDRSKIATLGQLGFRVLVIWECQTGNPAVLDAALKGFLRH